MASSLPAAIVGDLKGDQSAHDINISKVSESIVDHWFKSHITPLPTTDYGTTIDRVYTRRNKKQSIYKS
jgi:hypothetical protein